MGAFNWVYFESSCPNCKSNAVIKAQTHTCSDYDGNHTGRFHDRRYRLGSTMAWWPEDDERFHLWKGGNKREKVPMESSPKSQDFECCYASCSNCDADLFVILEFHFCSPIKVIGLGLEEDWPEDYWK